MLVRLALPRPYSRTSRGPFPAFLVRPRVRSVGFAQAGLTLASTGEHLCLGTPPQLLTGRVVIWPTSLLKPCPANDERAVACGRQDDLPALVPVGPPSRRCVMAVTWLYRRASLPRPSPPSWYPTRRPCRRRRLLSLAQICPACFACAGSSCRFGTEAGAQ